MDPVSPLDGFGFVVSPLDGFGFFLSAVAFGLIFWVRKQLVAADQEMQSEIDELKRQVSGRN